MFTSISLLILYLGAWMFLESLDEFDQFVRGIWTKN